MKRLNNWDRKRHQATHKFQGKVSAKAKNKQTSKVPSRNTDYIKPVLGIPGKKLLRLD